jgi:hypothetical protein
VFGALADFTRTILHYFLGVALSVLFTIVAVVQFVNESEASGWFFAFLAAAALLPASFLAYRNVRAERDNLAAQIANTEPPRLSDRLEALAQRAERTYADTQDEERKPIGATVGRAIQTQAAQLLALEAPEFSARFSPTPPEEYEHTLPDGTVLKGAPAGTYLIADIPRRLLPSMALLLREFAGELRNEGR